MLTIRPVADGAKFVWYVVDLSAFGNLFYQVGVILRPDNTGSPLYLGLKPENNAENSFGDKDCIHDNFHGDILLSPDGMCTEVERVVQIASTTPPYKYTGTRFFPNRLQPSLSTPECTHWVTQGIDLIIPPTYQYTPPNATYRYGCEQSMILEFKWIKGALDIIMQHHSWYKKTSYITYHSYRSSHYTYDFANSYMSSVNVLSNVKFGNASVFSQTSQPDIPAITSTKVQTMKAYAAVNWGTSITPPTFDMSECAKMLSRSLPAVDPNCFADLCRTAISDVHAIDINSIAYLKEFLELKDSILKLYRLLKGDITPKNIASLFLSYRYGLRLSVLDTGEIVEAAQRFSKERKAYRFRYCRAMNKSTTTVNKGILAGFSMEEQVNYKIYYEPIDNRIVDLYRKLVDLDLFPTLQNIWDLIPFSFVVDWFVDFENLFDTLDTRAYTLALRVLGTIKTTKQTIPVIPVHLVEHLFHQRGFGYLSGTFSYTKYNRVLGETLDLPPPRLVIQEDFSNFAELTAIIVTNVR